MSAIDKQAAINKLKERLIETALNNVGIMRNVDEVLVDVAEERLENWFDEVPSAQQWVSCSERMPTEEKDYIVSIDYGDEQHIGSDMFIIPKKGDPFWLISDHVVAWMEGPEPYRQG